MSVPIRVGGKCLHFREQGTGLNFVCCLSASNPPLREAQASKATLRPPPQRCQWPLISEGAPGHLLGHPGTTTSRTVVVWPPRNAALPCLLSFEPPQNLRGVFR